MKSKSQQEKAASTAIQSAETGTQTWVRKPVFPPISTAPKLNRTSMVARPWESIKLFSRRRKDQHENQQERLQERRAVARDGSSPRLVEWQRDGRMRRAVLFMLTFVQTAIAGVLTIDSLPMHADTLLERMVLILFTVLFFWVSAGFWTAMAGFLVLMRGDRHGVATAKAIKREAGKADEFRTAIVMPICNEDVSRVFAGLRATYESLAKMEQAGQFDVFVLSDSSDSDICTAELDAWSSLCRAVGGFGNIFYRRRKRRVKRKNGNIADFCRRWGKNYRDMVVLDADSVMSGECLTSLVDLMEANPDAGIIQTAPRVAGRETLYARIQQFASRAYGPLYTAGLHFWQLGESHYWGHNAIIRVEPFTRHCALAPLPGKGPLSGEILSHDFIEAALIRRAGYAVYMLPTLGGSYEESPPSLIDLAARDRRWCQGNLQHLRVLGAKGLVLASRQHFANGIMGYLASPLWMAQLLVGSALVLQTSYIRPEYFTADFALFPAWPRFDAERALQLFELTMGVLLAPKLFGLIAALIDRGTRRACGGGVRLFLSALLETVMSAFLAPIMMLIQSGSVVQILSGRDTGWNPQRRDDGSIPFRSIVRRHRAHTALGVLTLFASLLISPSLAAWMSPTIVGLILAIPLSWASGQLWIGVALRRLGLLTTPEETLAPNIVQRSNALSLELASAGHDGDDGLRAVHGDTAFRLQHELFLPSATRRRRGEVDVEEAVATAKLNDAKSLEEAIAWLKPKERMALLNDRALIALLVRLPAEAPSEKDTRIENLAPVSG